MRARPLFQQRARRVPTSGRLAPRGPVRRVCRGVARSHEKQPRLRGGVRRLGRGAAAWSHVSSTARHREATHSLHVSPRASSAVTRARVQCAGHACVCARAACAHAQRRGGGTNKHAATRHAPHSAGTATQRTSREGLDFGTPFWGTLAAVQQLARTRRGTHGVA
jgi:hypothetical protein